MYFLSWLLFEPSLTEKRMDLVMNLFCFLSKKRVEVYLEVWDESWAHDWIILEVLQKDVEYWSFGGILWEKVSYLHGQTSPKHVGYQLAIQAGRMNKKNLKLRDGKRAWEGII